MEKKQESQLQGQKEDGFDSKATQASNIVNLTRRKKTGGVWYHGDYRRTRSIQKN